MEVSSVDTAVQFLSTWLPPITLDDKIAFANAIRETDVTLGTHCVRKYVTCIKSYIPVIGVGRDGSPREPDCMASGITFFYGSLIYIMHFPNWGSHIEDIILYNILYILVDHYIDDMNINPEIKNQAIAQMKILVMDPLKAVSMDLIDPTFKTIASVYHKLITRSPAAKKSLMQLFYAEIEGMHIQKLDTYDRETYYHIAAKKGGYSLKVLQDIIGDPDESLSAATYNLGVITQLVDDLMDVNDDMRNGIHTIATHELKVRGTLDALWIEIVNRISGIDDQFTIFKIIYAAFIIYVPDRNKGSYTPSLLNQTNPLNIFDYTHGFNASRLLVECVTNEIIAHEILNHL